MSYVYLCTKAGDTAIRQGYGVYHDHLMVCEALGRDHTWYGVAASAEQRRTSPDPLHLGSSIHVVCMQSPFGGRVAMALRIQWLCSVLLVTLLGCAGRELPPSSPPPQLAVQVEESPSESFTTFFGIKHPYPGDASNTSFLRSVVEKTSGQVAHQLYVANYYRSSAGWIVWSRAHGEAAQLLEFDAIHRGVLSCGADGGCALVEEFGAVIPDPMLRAYQGGFSVTFSAETGQELVIHLTAQQIQQQLKAIADFQTSRKK